MKKQFEGLFEDFTDELLEKQLEGLFAETPAPDTAGRVKQQRSRVTDASKLPAVIASTSRVSDLGWKKRVLGKEQLDGLIRVLGGLSIVLICVVLVRSLWESRSEDRTARTAPTQPVNVTSLTPGLLPTSTPAESDALPRITIAAKYVSLALLNSAHPTSQSTEPTREAPSASATPATAAPTSTAAAVSTPAGRPPAPVRSLQATPIGFSRIRLDWQDDPLGEAGFVVHGGTRYITIAADRTSYIAEGLEDETEYCYMILAFNDYGASDWSSRACATTPQLFAAMPAFGLGSTSDLAWGDYDSDGDADLAVANDDEHNYMYVNLGDTFRQMAQFGTGRTWSLAWGDYDNDGDLDMAVGNGYGSAQNHLFVNNGDGTLTSRDEFNAASTEGLAWGDYDDDGDLDLAVGNEFDQQNYLYINSGNGTFIQSAQFGVSVTHALAWGDIDNDGDLDLAVGNQGQNLLFINNQGVFSRTLAFGTGDTKSIAWGDYDNDGDLDLAAGNSGNQQNYLYINQGAGTFSEMAAFGTGETYSVAWGDYDNDNDLDLAVGNFRDERNYLFVNNGDGTFEQRAAFGSGSTTSVAWGDYDNDGDVDLAVGNAFGQQNYLFVNQYTMQATGSSPAAVSGR